MKHPMELDDTSYSIDVTDMIISDYAHEVIGVNPFNEYLGELTYYEGESRQVPKVEHSNGQSTSLKGK